MPRNQNLCSMTSKLLLAFIATCAALVLGPSLVAEDSIFEDHPTEVPLPAAAEEAVVMYEASVRAAWRDFESARVLLQKTCVRQLERQVTLAESRGQRPEVERLRAEIDRIKQSGQAEDFQLGVRSARFGYGETWVDVTDRARSYLDGDTLTLPKKPHEAFGADPLPGEMKLIELVLSINGQDARVIVVENEWVSPLQITPADGERAAN